MRKVSAKGVARTQTTIDTKMRRELAKSKSGELSFFQAVNSDSFVNFIQQMGVGADNPTTTATYGFNPVSRVRTVLEWVHRGSWLGGVAIDLVADDMTRAGVDQLGQISPKDMAKIDSCAVHTRTWDSINETYKWARLYGGAIAVIMVEGQDPATELRIETVGKKSYKGLLVLDRWMVQPEINNIIQEPGPDIGLPRFYKVLESAPGLRGMKVHHSRCLRLIGVQLPYWQSLMEQMWGVSILERIWDRMTAFDSGSAGMAQLIYKAWIRTYSIEGLRNIITAGGQGLKGLLGMVEMMRRTQNSEGITLLDAKDKFESMQNNSFSGLSDAVLQLGQQLSGALQIPLVRLFGQSPAGMNATGESDWRNYYDNINKEQNKSIVPITTIYRVMGRSEGVTLSDDYGIKFRSLWQLNDKEKAEIAETDSRSIGAMESQGLISQQTAMKELKQSSKLTGRFSNITDEDIAAAEESLPPAGEEAAAMEHEASLVAAAGNQKKDNKKDAKKKPNTKDHDGHVVAEMKRVHDLDVIVESAKDSVRRGVGWEVRMPADYGYVRRSTAPDSQEVDAFFGPDLDSETVFVIDQIKLDTRELDEPKVIFGYKDTLPALMMWGQAYTDNRAFDRIGNLKAMTMGEFKTWLASTYPDSRYQP